MNIARLLLPAVRWNAETHYSHADAEIEAALELGVGGFILFGGEAAAVRELTTSLRGRSRTPLLIASDLERGAGQQFRGATPLPPAAALASLGDLEATERAGELTAREARALGVDWIYAPVADVELEPENPIIGTRAFGTDAETVAEQVAAWVRGCARGGAVSCAKHFPGHGRTRGDSHIERPVVASTRDELEDDLRPFASAIAAGTDSLMTAHVGYPVLDATGAPATLSRPILHDLLRTQMGFDGLVVTDALIMDGLTEDVSEAQAGVLALAAGCDVLLYPDDLAGVISELETAIREGRLGEERVRDAIARVDHACRGTTAPRADAWGADADRRWAMETAVRTLFPLRGSPSLGGTARYVEVEDDLGGPYPPYPRHAFPEALRAAGVEVTDDDGPTLIAVFSDIRAWKGRPGISPAARARVAELVEADPDATVVLFSHPRLAAELPMARHLLAAWGGESLMQEAAAAWLTGNHAALPTAASGLDR